MGGYLRNKKLVVLSLFILIMMVFSLSFVFVLGASEDICYTKVDCPSECIDDTSIAHYYCKSRPLKDTGVCVLRSITSCVSPKICAQSKYYAICVNPDDPGLTCIDDINLTTAPACPSSYPEEIGNTAGDEEVYRLCVKRGVGGLADVTLLSQWHPTGPCTIDCTDLGAGWEQTGVTVNYPSGTAICTKLCKKPGVGNIKDAKLIGLCTSQAQGLPDCPSNMVRKGGGWNEKGCSGPDGYGISLCVEEGVCELPLPPCEERDQSICNNTNDCSWCPIPDQTVYPYNFSDIYPSITVSNNKACVNITSDPFNCGGCGFKDGSPSVVPDYFCGYSSDASKKNYDGKPFCVNAECVSRGQDDNKANCGTVNLSTNPYFYYDVVQNSNKSYKSKWCRVVNDRTESDSVFSLDDIDSSETACKAVAGENADFVSGLGCCGAGKCREGVNLAEDIKNRYCDIMALCDGEKWHYGKEADGEVFRIPNCDEEAYPVANIQGYFTKCVDADKEEEYAEAHDIDPCILHGKLENQHDSFDPFLTGKAEYLCGDGYYVVSMHRGFVNDSYNNYCPGQRINTDLSLSSGVDLVCSVESENPEEAYAFAAILDGSQAGSEEGISVFSNNIKSDKKYDSCPGPILNWKGESSEASAKAIVPCPGRTSLGDVSIKPEDWLISYGGPDHRIVVLCKEKSSESDGRYNLPKTRRVLSGTIMGAVNGNQYVCYVNQNEDKEEIGVCCGNKSGENCGGDIPGDIGSGGVEYYAGDWVNISGNLIYCLDTGQWGYDLDKESLQGACTNAGFSATGHYCCAEWDDTSTWINESYTDSESSVGACFKGVPQYNNNSLIYNGFEYKNVFVFNGGFYGCGFNNSLFKPEYDQGEDLCKPGAEGMLSQDCLERVEDWPNPGTGRENTRTKQPLIRSADYCRILNTSSGSFFCSYNNTWLDTLGENLSHQSEVPEPLLEYFKNVTSNPGLEGLHCCMPNTCWDPSANTCIPEQLGAGDYYKINSTTGYKCVQGQWEKIMFTTGKTTPDGCSLGFCLGKSQCLYDVNGNPDDNNNVSPGAHPQCIADGQYINDYLCDNGNWTSRTKLLALKLASLITGENDDFVLMCGLPDELLINMQNPGASNNFCVLYYKGQRIIGTTLNQPFYNATTHDDFVTALEQSFLFSYPDAGVGFNAYCDESTKDFEKCVDNDYLKLYYDDDYKTVIFSDKDVSGLTPGLGQTLCNALPSWLKWLCPGPSSVEKDFEKLRLFNKVYAARRVSNTRKEVFGVAENICVTPGSLRSWDYSFNYTGFSSADLGYLVNNIDATNASITLSQNHIFIRNPGGDAWTALTLLRNPEQG